MINNSYTDKGSPGFHLLQFLFRFLCTNFKTIHKGPSGPSFHISHSESSLCWSVSLQKMSPAQNHQQPHQIFDVDGVPQGASKCFDDDGRLKRTGNFLYPSRNFIQVLASAWKLLISFSYMPNRYCLDCQCSHNNSCDRVWCSLLSVGHCSARMDSWPGGAVSVLLCNVLYIGSSFFLLPYG